MDPDDFPDKIPQDSEEYFYDRSNGKNKKDVEILYVGFRASGCKGVNDHM